MVMISKDKVKKSGIKDDKEGDEEYQEVYAELLKLVQKAGATLRI